MALRHADVEAITVVGGNVPLDQAVQNALYTVELAGADVPVHAGLDGAQHHAQDVHGQDGMGDIGLHPEGLDPEGLDLGYGWSNPLLHSIIDDDMGAGTS